MLAIRVAAKRLGARPLPYGKMRVRGEELSRFLLGLVDPAKPGKGGSQYSPRPRPVGCFIPQSVDSILLPVRCIFHVPPHPVTAAGRVRIQAESLLNTLDPLDGVTQMRLRFTEKDPRVGLIGIEPQRRRKFRRCFIRLKFKEQNVTQDRVRGSIPRIERHSLFSLRPTA